MQRLAEAPVTVLLKRCRARMAQPADYGRQAKRGISQDTAALLANISTYYYQQIETGTLKVKPSSDILGDIATALQMMPQERDALHIFSRGELPPQQVARTPSSAPWRDALDIVPMAACLCRHDWQIVHTNEAFDDLCPAPVTVGASNLMDLFILTPELRDTWLLDWEGSWADPMLFELLLASALYPRDPVIARLIEDVALDPAASRVWDNLATASTHPSGALRPLRMGGRSVPTRLLQANPSDQPTWKIIYLLPRTASPDLGPSAKAIGS